MTQQIKDIDKYLLRKKRVFILDVMYGALGYMQQYNGREPGECVRLAIEDETGRVKDE